MGKFADWLLNHVGFSLALGTAKDREKHILAEFQNAGGVSTVGNHGKLSVPDLEKIKKLIKKHSNTPAPQ
ncbi:MAG TPA: hypothetical protein DCY07_04860 [Rhodospirillaceae bacterium]|nr:hypothetical protein [Rhodospirillaceae bacterium]